MSPNQTTPEAARAALLARCPPFRFTETPWDSLPPNPDCRAAVADPEETLDFLRRAFPDAILEEAGLLERSPEGRPRLAPPLCDPDGAVLALRRHPGGAVYDLLTSRGCLASRRLPVLASWDDRFTFARFVKSGVLFAADDIRDVALLRTLGLPATLSTGLERTTLKDFRSLRQAFADVLPCGSPCVAEIEAALSAEGYVLGADLEPAESRPTLVLLGWQIRSLRPDFPPTVSPVAARLHGFGLHLGVELAEVAVWRPNRCALDKIAFCLAVTPPGCYATALLRSYKDQLYTLESCADPEKAARVGTDGAPVDVVEARARLLEQLREDRGERRASDRTREALAAYDTLTRRDLIEPLQRWALASADPVLRNLGVELANVCDLLHQMAPHLHELQARDLEQVLARGVAPARGGLLQQYTQLSARLARLLTHLGRLRKGAP
jgi:hypothetical protein